MPVPFRDPPVYIYFLAFGYFRTLFLLPEGILPLMAVRCCSASDENVPILSVKKIMLHIEFSTKQQNAAGIYYENTTLCPYKVDQNYPAILKLLGTLFYFFAEIELNVLYTDKTIPITAMSSYLFIVKYELPEVIRSFMGIEEVSGYVSWLKNEKDFAINDFQMQYHTWNSTAPYT